MIEIEKSRKKSLVVFKDVAEKNSPFRKDPSHSQNKQRGGGRYCYVGEPGNRDQHNGRFNNQYGRFQNLFKNNSGRKFQYGSSATQGKYLFGSFHQQLKTGTTGINDFDTSSSKKIIYPRNTRCTTGRKAISVGKTVEKITRDQEILSIVKGYQIPFTNLPVQEKHPNTIKMSEQQSLLVDREISELLEKGVIPKAETAKRSF